MEKKIQSLQNIREMIDEEFEKLKNMPKHIIDDDIEKQSDRFIVEKFELYKFFDVEQIWYIQDAFQHGAKWYREQLKNNS
jgi:hypothetical protein